MKHSIRRLAVAATFATLSGTALATPCDNALSLYSGGILTPLSAHPECFAGGWTNVINQISGTSFEQALAISRALQNRWASDAPGPRAALGMRGMAAGGAAKRWNLWGNVSNNETKHNYLAANGFTTDNDMDVLNTSLGADFLWSPGLVFGVSVAFDKGEGSGLNSSGTDVLKNIDSDGYMIAPYVGWQINRNWSLDASAGWGSGKVRSNFSTESENDRWFAAANLNYERWFGSWQLAGKLSLLHGVEDYDNTKVAGTSFANTGAKNTIDQLRIGAQVGYWMNGFLPYAGIGYTNDLTRKTTQAGAPSDPIGDDAWFWTVGANFFSLAGGVYGGIAYRQEESRDNSKNKNIMLNLGLRF